MSVSQAVGLQPWRHLGLREKAGAGNVGEGLIGTKPPRGDDVLAGGLRPQPHSDPEAAPQEGNLGQDLDPPPGGAQRPPRSEIGAQIQAGMEDWGVDFSVKF